MKSSKKSARPLPPGLIFWALIVFFLAGTGDAAAANDDVTPVGPPRKALGYLTFLVLLLIIVPAPHALYFSSLEIEHAQTGP